jgi:hypothetical protein
MNLSLYDSAEQFCRLVLELVKGTLRLPYEPYVPEV